MNKVNTKSIKLKTARASIVVLILLAVLLVDNNFAESQPPPSQTPQIKAEVKSNDTIKHQNPSSQTDKMTNTPVSIIPKVTPKIENGITKKTTENREEQGPEFWPSFFGFRIKITDSLLVFFTAILALFTWFLHRSTRKLWKAGEEQMKITRDSLALAREEFISAHRPKLIIRSVTFKPHGFPVIGEPVQIEGVVVNIGNTATEIIESSITAIVGDQIFGARTPFAPACDNINGVKLVPGGAYTFWLTSETVVIQNSSVLVSITSGAKVIYFFGFIMYRDEIGNMSQYLF